MESVKDLALVAGVPITLVLSLMTLYFSWKSSKRTSFVNTVTSERVKWIGKVRENIAELCALCDQWMLNLAAGRTDLQHKIERLKNEIRLQLNPIDPHDQTITKLLTRLPTIQQSMTPQDYAKIQNELISATQRMLKREWDKVKDEANHGRI